MITTAPVKQKKKKEKSVKLCAEENSGEAAVNVSLSTPREWEIGEKNQTELQHLSEEDSDRARLPGGGRKKASEELEINMQGWVISKRARHERVSRKMIRGDGETNVRHSEWQQRWGVCRECWSAE